MFRRDTFLRETHPYHIHIPIYIHMNALHDTFVDSEFVASELACHSQHCSQDFKRHDGRYVCIHTQTDRHTHSIALQPGFQEDGIVS